MKYRKREEFDAVQWFKPGDQPRDLLVHPTGIDDWYIIISTTGRGPSVHPGDWIITHADGTHSVCKAADFEREYERIEG